ncbi:MAG: ABC-type transport auxiliary lipoprotein family protein [Betaproteobacteria bacterium]
MKPAPRRSFLIVGCSALLLAGCISVDIGSSDSNVRAQYRLHDLAPAPGRADRPVTRSLVVVALPSPGIGDTFSMAYSRAPQQRALYQNASWADRPSNRTVQLLVRRIDARASFASVAELGSGVRGDLLLNVTIDELLHDTVAARGRLELTAELVDRATRTLVARRRFSAEAPVAQEDARATVEALSRALTSVLDDLVPWLEAAAGKLPAAAAR